MLNVPNIFRQLFDRNFDKSICVNWDGYTDSRGYGMFGASYNGERHAHRIAAMIGFQVDSLPPGSVVAHICDNPSCINPYHLRVVTQRENMHDRFAKAGSKGYSRIDETITWDDNYTMLQGWKYYTQEAGDVYRHPVQKRPQKAHDYRLLPDTEKPLISRMTTEEIMENYKITERTAQRWKQYVQAEFGDGDQK